VEAFFLNELVLALMRVKEVKEMGIDNDDSIERERERERERLN
jgi:hypothetical protein